MLWRKIRRRKEWQGERKKGEKKEEREGVFYKKETREEEKEEETEKRWKKERRKERPGSWEGKKERKIKHQGQDPHTTARMPPGNQSLTLAKILPHPLGILASSCVSAMECLTKSTCSRGSFQGASFCRKSTSCCFLKTTVFSEPPTQ